MNHIAHALARLLATFLVLYGGVASAQYTSSGLLDASVDKIAEYTAVDSAGMDELLRDVGYKPLISTADWIQLSDYEKLRIAAQEAEEWREGASKTLIASVRAKLIHRTPSFASEPLPAGASVELAVGHKLGFRRPPAGAGKALPPAVLEAVATIAEYASRPSAPISAREIMARFADCAAACFLREVMKAGSIRKAVRNRFASMANPPRDKRVGEAALKVQEGIPAARHERALAAAVYRFTFSNDWVGIRNQWEDAVVRGELNLPDEKKSNHRKALSAWNEARPLIIKALLDQKIAIDAGRLERAFYETAAKTPDIAAGWSFAVISLFPKSEVFDQYVPENTDRKIEQFVDEEVEKMKGLGAKLGTPLSRSEIANVRSKVKKKWEARRPELVGLMKERGAYPVNGWQYYAVKNKFTGHAAATKFGESREYNDAVGKMCPH